MPPKVGVVAMDKSTKAQPIPKPHMPKNPVAAIEAYFLVLKYSESFACDIEKTSSDSIVICAEDNTKNLKVSVGCLSEIESYYIRVEQTDNIRVVYTSDFNVVDSGDSANDVVGNTKPSTGMQSETTTKASNSTGSSKTKNGKIVLQSPDAFFNNRLARLEDMEVTDENGKQHWLITFKMEIDKGMLAAKEYSELIGNGNFGLEIQDVTEETVFNLLLIKYMLNCTEKTDVPVLKRYMSGSANVLCEISKNGTEEHTMLTLSFDPDYFTFEDLGYRSKYDDLVDLSGKQTQNNSVNLGGVTPAARDCPECDGTGDCKKCQGSGFLWSSASGKKDRNCTACHPNYGNCHKCNGTGKQ